MMRLQPRYTVAVNFRQQDKLLLDARTTIAREGTNISSVLTAAIEEYVRTGLQVELEIELHIV